MRLLDRLTPRSITAQITCIVAISVALGIVLVMAIMLFFIEGDPRYSVTAMATQVGTVTRLARASKTDDEVAAILVVARDTGIKVSRVALSELEISPRDCCLSIEALLLVRRLQSRWSVDALEVAPPPGTPPDQLAVKLNERDALVFEGVTAYSFWTIVLAPSALTLIIVLLFVVLLSIYAVRWIISPLSAVAAAAQSFGRSPDDDRIVSRRGPREIVQVADALNDMRTRIRALLGSGCARSGSPTRCSGKGSCTRSRASHTCSTRRSIICAATFVPKACRVSICRACSRRFAPSSRMSAMPSPMMGRRA
jgi:nitrate/nitrite-specific signal transduction histidine kinase